MQVAKKSFSYWQETGKQQKANAIFSNQQFRDWLHEYVAITKKATLSKKQLLSIKAKISTITEPLEAFTEWFDKTIDAIAANDYSDRFIQLFLPIIRQELHAVLKAI